MEKYRIVVVDDCKLTLTIARDMLEGAGYEVLIAQSGLEANSHIYKEPRPDLILMDVVMPMQNGDRKLQLLRQRDSSADIPVVLFSSKPERELRRLAQDAGADGYLCKPLQQEALLAKVARLIRQGQTAASVGTASEG